MIEEIFLENFRCWKGPHSVGLKPLTLLYGPNSAGKSSIFHVLGVLRQTLEDANGPTIELKTQGRHADVGGFRAAIHGGDLSRTLSLGIVFKPGADEPELGTGPVRITVEAQGRVQTDGQSSRGALSAFRVELGSGQPDAEQLDLTVDGTRGFAFTKNAITVLMARFVPDLNPKRMQRLIDHLETQTRFSFFEGVPYFVSSDLHQPDAEPESETSDSSAEPDPLEEHAFNQARAALLRGWQNLAARLGTALRQRLSSVRHLGPLRRALPRASFGGVLGAGHNDVGSEGQALASVLSDASVQQQVNDALKRLEPRGYYQVVEPVPIQARARAGGSRATTEVYEEPDQAEEDDFRPVRVRLQREGYPPTVSLSDVGFGVSQVLPIVAQLCSGEGLLHLFEQPEAHLGQGIQRALARLLAERAANAQVIIESHSRELVDALSRVKELSSWQVLEVIPPKRQESGQWGSARLKDSSFLRALIAMKLAYAPLVDEEEPEDDDCRELAVEGYYASTPMK